MLIEVYGSVEAKAAASAIPIGRDFAKLRQSFRGEVDGLSTIEDGGGGVRGQLRLDGVPGLAVDDGLMSDHKPIADE